MDQTFPVGMSRRRSVPEAPTQKSEQTSVRSMSLTMRVLFWIYTFSFAFDFKNASKGKVSEVGGTAIQYVFAVICILSGIGLCLFYSKSRGSKSLKKMILFWCFFLLTTLLMFVIHHVSGDGVEPQYYLRAILPFCFIGLSLFVVQSLYKNRIHPREILKPLIIAGICSSLWTIFYATRLRGIAIEEMRYQILGPFTPLIFAFGLIGIFLDRKPRPLAVLAFLISMMTILLSITRSYVITLVFCMVALVYFYLLDRKLVSMSYLMQKILLLLIPFAVLQITMIVRPQVMLYWEYRLFHRRAGQKQDVTYVTRIAEYSWMWKEMNKDTIYLLFGRGVGREHRWDTQYRGQLAKYTHFDGSKRNHAGHSVWMYSLYSSGFIFGGMIYVMFVIGLHRGFKLAKLYARFGDTGTRQVILLPFIAWVAYLSQTFTANPINERATGQILGMLLGTSFWVYDQIKLRDAAASPPALRSGMVIDIN